MKRIFIYGLLLTVVIACQQEDITPLGRPEERVEEMLKGYQEQLVGSSYGWNGYIFPGLGAGFSFHLEFSEQGRVTMMADINSDCATEPFESSYRMERAQRPSLFFDTYSYLHILSDPHPDTIGGAVGQGLLSDFEFAFESSTTDTIMLKGNQNGTPFMLIRASAEEATDYRNGKVNTVIDNAVAYAQNNPFVYLRSADGKRINTSINLYQKVFALSYPEGDSLNITSVPFAFTSKGIFLQYPVRYESMQFQEVFFDAMKRAYYFESAGARMDLVSSKDPVLPLNLLLGVDFNVISVPPQQLPGFSQTFTSIRQTIAANLSFYSLGLSHIEFAFNTENRTLNIDVIFVDLNTGRYYLAVYPYAYTKSDGVFEFERYNEPNGNGKFFQEIMDPMLAYFDNYRFRMEYFNTGSEYIGQMKCVDRSFFYFTGNFGSAF